jgi:hypothetical protein
MQVYLDGKPFLVKSRIDPLQLLGMINERLNKQGRVLQQVLVNGQVVQDNWLQMLINIPEQDSISFISVPASQLLEESIVTTIEILPQLADDLKQAAHYLQIGVDDKAFPLISNSVSGLESYNQLLTLLSQYLPDQSATVARHLDPLAQSLQKLMSAWQSEDFVLMADYLLYEIEPQLQHGHRWLKTLID